MKPCLRAVTFDVTGTLVEAWPSVGHVYAAVAAEVGLAADPALLNERFRAAWERHGEMDHSRESWRDIVRGTFEGICPAGQADDLFPAIYERFSEASAWRVYEDVRPCLRALSERGVVLGVISNWDSRLHRLLERCALAPFFKAVTVSLEVGHRKPAPQIFQAAASAMGIPPEHILHVGDSASEDVAGARQAGFGAVRIRRRRPELGDLATLDELPGVMEQSFGFGRAG